MFEIHIKDRVIPMTTICAYRDLDPKADVFFDELKGCVTFVTLLDYLVGVSKQNQYKNELAFFLGHIATSEDIVIVKIDANGEQLSAMSISECEKSVVDYGEKYVTIRLYCKRTFLNFQNQPAYKERYVKKA